MYQRSNRYSLHASADVAVQIWPSHLHGAWGCWGSCGPSATTSMGDGLCAHSVCMTVAFAAMSARGLQSTLGSWPVPKKPEVPIDWYLNTPIDKPWVAKTRDTALDPKLVRIDEVFKNSVISSAKSRSVRPHGWQRSLVARCVLADPFGGQYVARIQWPALLQNATWAKMDVVQYVQDWLPNNLGYIGAILHPQPRMAYVAPMPAPTTPWTFEDSTVRIEEVAEGALSEDDRLEVQAPLGRQKRRRVS